jgi:hypothetical protein
VITLSAITLPGIRPGEVCWCAFRDGPAPALLRRRTDRGWAYVSRLGSGGQWLSREIRVQSRDLCHSFGAACVAYAENQKLRQQQREAVRFYHDYFNRVFEPRARVPARGPRPSKGVRA